MIKVSILYPNEEGAKFNWDYYLNKHIPLSKERQGAAIKGVSVEKGIMSGMPDSKPPYIAICHLLYDSLEAFFNAFMPHANELMEDIKNYTDVKTVVQISEVKINE